MGVGVQPVSSETSEMLSVPTDRIKIGLALFALYIIWGSTYLGMRFAVESFPPFMMVSIRFMVAGTLMFAFLVLRGHALPTLRQTRNAMLIGLLLLGVGTGGVAFAEELGVASGLAALAVAVVPIWAALFSGLFGRFPGKREWIGLGVGLAGVVLLNLENGLQGEPLGALVLLIAPACWAFGSILSRQIELPKGLMATAIEMFGGAIALLPVSWLTGEQMTHVPTTTSVLALLYLIFFGSLIGFTAYTYLLQKVRPVLATSYAYVNPMVAVGLGIVLGGEQITPLGIVAMFVILGGVALMTLVREQQSK